MSWSSLTGGRLKLDFDRTAPYFPRMIPLVVSASFAIAFALSSGFNWLALVPWRRSVGLHWTERARQLYPARNSSRVNLWVITAGITAMGQVYLPTVYLAFEVFPAFIGALLGNYFLIREIYPDLALLSWARFRIVLTLVIYGTLLFVPAGALLMPAQFGISTLLLAAMVLICMVALQFRPRSWLLARLGIFRPAPPRLTRIVSELSAKMHVRVCDTWTVGGPIYNAAALPTTRELVFTEKLLESHPDEEISAICAHELGHLGEPRSVLYARLAVIFSFYPLIFTRPLGELLGLISFLYLWIPVLVLISMSRRLGQRMERRADRIAVEQQANPAVYARALGRLYEQNATPAVMPKRSRNIHPDLYDRMLVAGITPDFPKPAPPKSQSWTTIAALAIFPLVASLIHTAQLWWAVRSGTNVEIGL